MTVFQIIANDIGIPTKAVRERAVGLYHEGAFTWEDPPIAADAVLLLNALMIGGSKVATAKEARALGALPLRKTIRRDAATGDSSTRRPGDAAEGLVYWLDGFDDFLCGVVASYFFGDLWLDDLVAGEIIAGQDAAEELFASIRVLHEVDTALVEDVYLFHEPQFESHRPVRARTVPIAVIKHLAVALNCQGPPRRGIPVAA